MNATSPLRSRRRSTRRPASGFSLVEVLVAVFVLSIGLLGMAGLQITSKRSNLEALQRSVATTLAQDIVERMRANAVQLEAYTNAGAGRTLTGATLGAVNCSVSCTADQLALYDMYEWERQIAGVAEQSGGANVGALSSPTACITGPNGTSGIYTVAIAWRGLTALSDPAVDACGQGSGLYDSNDGVQADVHRRVLFVSTYIAEPV